MTDKERVVLLGASDKPDRYAFRAFKLLCRHGHEVIPVNPALKELDGVPVVARIEDITGPVDTVTLYLGSARLAPLIDALIALKPRRIIANPGTENDTLRQRATAAGIEYEQACTLVLLHSGQF
ncbi:MAG TPA: CoA-binding protein [bacterium]|nr:CoA-binding protein [bacterium]